jgi:hypothetical protein
MRNNQAVTQQGPVQEGASNVITFRIEIPKDLPRVASLPSRPQTVAVNKKGG